MSPLAIEPRRDTCGRLLANKQGWCKSGVGFEARNYATACHSHRTREEHQFVRAMLDRERAARRRERPACWSWPIPDDSMIALDQWQQGRCAMCGEVGGLGPDVDEFTGYLRGFLCSPCLQGPHEFASERCLRRYRKRSPAAILGRWDRWRHLGSAAAGRLHGLRTEGPILVTPAGEIRLPQLYVPFMEDGVGFWASTPGELPSLRARAERLLDSVIEWEAEARRYWPPDPVPPARSRMKSPPRNCPPIEGLGYVYVVEFSTGAIKVGMSTNPASRWYSYRHAAAPFAVHITRMWVSPPHRNYRIAETELISFCTARGRPLRVEYFECIAYADVVAYASVLPEWADRQPQAEQETDD